MPEEIKDDKEKEESSGLMWLGIGIGIIVGGIIVALIIKATSPSSAPASTLQSASFPGTPIVIYPTYSLSPQGSIQSSQPVTMQQEQTPLETLAYKNNEKWEIERGDDGYIKGINVLRDVKVDTDAREE